MNGEGTVSGVATAAAAPIWNVRCTVIDLIPAATAEAAIERLTAALQDKGFDVHVDCDYTQDAFLSEPLSVDADDEIRRQWPQ